MPAKAFPHQRGINDIYEKRPLNRSHQSPSTPPESLAPESLELPRCMDGELIEQTLGDDGTLGTSSFFPLASNFSQSIGAHFKLFAQSV